MPNPGGTGWPESGSRWCINAEQLREHARDRDLDKGPLAVLVGHPLRDAWVRVWSNSVVESLQRVI
jgi:hypothetical protein